MTDEKFKSDFYEPYCEAWKILKLIQHEDKKENQQQYKTEIENLVKKYPVNEFVSRLAGMLWDVGNVADITNDTAVDSTAEPMSGKDNLRPSSNKDVQTISSECYAWWKRYNRYTNASPDKNLHFSESVWEEILGYTDKDGVYHMGTFDQVYYRHPCEFTYNMLGAFLDELKARDQGSYKREEDISF